MLDRRERRTAALRERLAEEPLDGLIVTHLPNIRYLTGFTGSSAVVVVLRDSLIFFSDFRYRTQADEEVGDAARIEIIERDIWERVWRVLGEYAGIDLLGFESESVTVRTAERFASADTKSKFRPVKGLVERLREQKDEQEIEAIRAAAALAEEALDATLADVAVGRSELDIAATLEAELRRRGSEWHPFPTIVASGPRSALPHAGTGRREIQAGDWLLLDFGAQVDGYCADLTRTVVVGRRADERQQAIYELVRDAQRHARTAIRAGMTGQDADQLARKMISARGFGDAFGHSLGHGLGLEVHEGPRVSVANTDPLPDRAVVTIEPGVYLPGWGGVRLEDDVLLHAGGAELLSSGRTELRELV